MANKSDRHDAWNDEWREALDGAEVPPAPRVWNNIENGLALQEGRKYRRGFLIYRGIAAALLLLIAGLSWYILADREDTTVREANTTTAAPPLAEERKSRTAPLMSEDSGPPDALTSGEDSTPGDPDTKLASPTTGKPLAEQAPSLAYREAADGTSDAQPSSEPSVPTPSDSERSLAKADASESPAPNRPNETGQVEDPRNTASLVAVVAPGDLSEPPPRLPSVADVETLYRVPQPFAPQKPKDKDHDRPAFFAGLAMAPSYFDPQFQASAANLGVLRSAGPNAAPGLNAFSMENESLAPSPSAGIESSRELSFAYGVDVGIKLAEHWVLESGIDYNRFNTNSETRWVVADVASGARYPYVAANISTLNNSLRDNISPSLTATTPINNTYEFVAVPLKIGYSVAIRKFQLTLSSGVAANFFLNNGISAPAGDQLTNYSLDASDAGSPFKALYYSGLLSGGVNYNVLGNYFLSLTPSYSFALTELTREASGLNSQPYSFGVNVGVQYQF